MSASLLIQKVKPELYDLARKYEYVHSIFEKMAGGELVQFNNSLFLSEKTSEMAGIICLEQSIGSPQHSGHGHDNNTSVPKWTDEWMF